MTNELYKYGTALTLLLSLCAAAQPRVEARLDLVPYDGFFRIVLTTELTRVARSNLADVRISDVNGEPVPYRLEAGKDFAPRDSLSFPIVSTRQDSTQSQYVFSVPRASTESFSVFTVASTTREASLSGSKDGVHWYSLYDRFLFAPEALYSGQLAYQEIYYPSNDYRFLRLQIHNGRAAPIDLRFAGILGEEVARTLWLPVNRLPFHSATGPGYSSITISNPTALPVERLIFNINSPAFFDRHVILTEPGGRMLADTRITQKNSELICARSTATRFLLRIETGDNPLLHINEVLATQHQYELIVFLKKGAAYRLTAGDPQAQSPRYDLSAFTEVKSRFVRHLGYGPLHVLPTGIPKKRDQRTWIWIALCIGILVLGAVSFSLLRDVKKGTAGGAD